jgi:hypothetical protein
MFWPQSTFDECKADVFGGFLPQGVAANTALPLSIDSLRQEARKALVHMGMVPASYSTCQL